MQRYIIISIVSGFDECWIEIEQIERSERIIGLVEGRRNENRTRTVQGKSIVKWDFAWKYYQNSMVNKSIEISPNYSAIDLHPKNTPHETSDQKSKEKNSQHDNSSNLKFS
jgi:hypothetical protein